MSVRKRIKALEAKADEVGRGARYNWLFGTWDKGKGLFRTVQDILDHLGLEYKTTPEETKLVKVTKKAKK